MIDLTEDPVGEATDQVLAAVDDQFNHDILESRSPKFPVRYLATSMYSPPSKSNRPRHSVKFAVKESPSPIIISDEMSGRKAPFMSERLWPDSKNCGFFCVY
jgi:hypothetical protein